jgi:hypothetical protein
MAFASSDSAGQGHGWSGSEHGPLRRQAGGVGRDRCKVAWLLRKGLGEPWRYFLEPTDLGRRVNLSACPDLQGCELGSHQR